MAVQWVRIFHPETGGEATVALSALKHHIKNGWVRVEDDDGTAGVRVPLDPDPDPDDAAAEAAFEEV